MDKKRKHRLQNGRIGAAITVRLTPGSSRNSIDQILEDGTIKISLGSSLKEGQANLELVNFLANVLEVNPGDIEIVAGLEGFDKLVTILNIDAITVQKRVISKLEKKA
jgi:uncharacterized protein YggU (UPF0235/DUF167 family)